MNQQKSSRQVRSLSRIARKNDPQILENVDYNDVLYGDFNMNLARSCMGA